jgi:hypothetical protein
MDYLLELRFVICPTFQVSCALAWCLRGACVVLAWCLRCACVVLALCLRCACVVLALCLRCACVVLALCLRGACVVLACALCTLPIYCLLDHSVAYSRKHGQYPTVIILYWGCQRRLSSLLLPWEISPSCLKRTHNSDCCFSLGMFSLLCITFYLFELRRRTAAVTSNLINYFLALTTYFSPSPTFLKGTVYF